MAEYVSDSSETTVVTSSDEWGTTKVALLVVGVGVLTRFLVVFVLGTFSNPELFEYDDMARSLNSGFGYVYRHFGVDYKSYYPGVPYIAWTAFLYSLFPKSVVLGQAAVLLAQSVMSGLLAYVVFLIGREVWNGRAGVGAAGLTLLHPGLAYYDIHKLHPLSFDTLFVTFVVWALLRLRTSESFPKILLTGIVLGIALLQRGSLALFVPVSAMWVWLTGSQALRVRIQRSVVFTLGVVVAISPWLIRNYQVHGVPLMATTSGEHFWLGNAPHSFGSATLPSGELAIDQSSAAVWDATSEMEQNGIYWQAAMDNVNAAPGGFVVGIFKKFVYFWTIAPQTGVRYPGLYSVGYFAFYIPLILFAFVGAWRVANRDNYETSDALWVILLIGSVCLSVSLIHSLLYFELRHRWLLEPMLAVFAAIGILKYFGRTVRPGQPVSAEY